MPDEIHRFELMVDLSTRPDVPFRAQQPEQARRPPAPTGKPTEPRSAASAVGAADPTRSGAEQRAKTTAIAIVAAAHIGTSGAPVGGKHARRRPT